MIKCIFLVVGHTPPPFSRYTGKVTTTHIRNSKNMQAVCVDGGMVFGTLSFLEIRAHTDNHFIAHEYIADNTNEGRWIHRDMTEAECSIYVENI